MVADADSAPSRCAKGAPPSHPEAGLRADLTNRIAADIADVALVLAQLRHEDLTPPVVQMVQQRIHDLAIGICQVVACPAADLSEVKGQLYPSELEDGSAL